MVCVWEGADSGVAIIYGQLAEPQASSLPRPFPGAPACVNEPLHVSPHLLCGWGAGGWGAECPSKLVL